MLPFVLALPDDSAWISLIQYFGYFLVPMCICLYWIFGGCHFTYSPNWVFWFGWLVGWFFFAWMVIARGLLSMALCPGGVPQGSISVGAL